MAQAVLIVLLVVILVAYGAFFALWNQQAVDVVGLSAPFVAQGGWTSPIPVFVLPLAGLAIGAILMAIVIGSPWSSMKRALAETRERLGVEQARSRDLSAKLKACRERLKSTAASGTAAGDAQPMDNTAEGA